MLTVRMGRRDSLRLGALGAFSGGLLQRLAAAPASAGKPRAKSVVLIFLGGGISHHDTFDPKPDAPPEVRGKYGTQATPVPGVRFTDKIPLLANRLPRYTLVRSGSHHNDHHETATNWVLSGRFGSPFGDYPAMGAVVSQQLGFRGELPPYVAIPKNPSFTWELGRSAFLGGRHESFKTGDPAPQNFRVDDLAAVPGMAASGANRDRRRKNLREAVDGLARQVEANDQIQTYDAFQQRAAEMVLSPAARRAFSLESETDRTRERYGRTTFGQGCLLARRLVEGGVRWITVNHAGWDHHAKIFEGLDKKLPEFDRALSAFLDDMGERGLLEETLVAVFGEFGRTPTLNKDAGRDHWGKAGSLLFAGAGTRPGLVLGATDKLGGFPTRRPVGPADVAATLLDSLGIDPKRQITTPDGRPLEILDQGEVVRELFA